MQWFMNLKIAQKFLVFMSLALLGLSVTGIASFFSLGKTAGQVESMYTEELVPYSLLQSGLQDAYANRANVYRLILESDSAKQQEIVDNIGAIGKHFLKIMGEYEKGNLSKEEKEELAKLKESLKKYKADRIAVADLALAGQRQDAYQYFIEHENSFVEFMDIMDKMAKKGETKAKEESIQSVKAANTIKFVILTVAIVTLALIAAAGLWFANMLASRLTHLTNHVDKIANENDLTAFVEVKAPDEIGILGANMNKMAENLKNIVQEIAHSSEDMSASSEEMNASAEQTAMGAQQTATSTAQLAQGAQEISRNIEDGATNVNKLNKAIQGVSEEAKVVAKLSNDTELNANEGAEHVKKAVVKIDSIKKVSEDISVNITELGQLSAEIEQIVDLIKNIAGQTNLLALNAAIEAARAGEHGKGFAVVADEVKKLAGQSADATEKITSMIKEIQSKTHIAVTTMDKATHEVEEGVTVISDAGKALNSIITQAKAANNKIQEITKDIDGVARNSEELVQMIENVSSITEETAASAEEISSITEEQTASLEEISASSHTLASIAEKLAKQVSVFKV
jgi:methyl-accepting chemotaxis protein